MSPRVLRALVLVLVVGFAAPVGTAIAQRRACSPPDKSFEAFIAKFTEDKQFQRTRIIYPVVFRFGRLEFEDLDIELWDTKKVAELKAPLMMSRAERKQYGISQELQLIAKEYAEVYHYKPEADSYEVLFSFRRVNGCWFLEGLHDTSL